MPARAARTFAKALEFAYLLSAAERGARIYVLVRDAGAGLPVSYITCVAELREIHRAMGYRVLGSVQCLLKLRTEEVDRQSA